MIVVGGSTTLFSGGASLSLITAGASILANSVVQMLGPQSKGLKGHETPENVPSYAFGGPVNTVAQGHPVGVPYGKCRIGGAVISADIYTKDRL